VQIVALISITTHFLFFAFNGKGVSGLENFGDVLEIFSQVGIKWQILKRNAFRHSIFAL
jgi:hypothetical protein